jgi:hypothetical protein
MRRAAALATLLASVLAPPAHADAASRGEVAFELRDKRVQAVGLAASAGEVAVYARLTETAARALARRPPPGHVVVVHAGALPLTRVRVRDALRARPARTIQSTPMPAYRARALARALRHPCSPAESR